MRRNGFSQPFHPFQVGSWLAILIFTAYFEALICPFVADSGFLGLQVGYGTSLGTTVVAGAWCSIIDPIDHLEAGKSSNAYCVSCQRFIFMESKHCLRCAKCVYQLDHHCKWLNTCIGAANGHVFMCLLVALQTALSLLFFSSLYVSMRLFLESQSGGLYSSLHKQRISGAQAYYYGAAVIGMSAVLSVLFFMCAKFLVLQVYLRATGRTMYEYIKQRNVRVVAEAKTQRGQITTEIDIVPTTTVTNPDDKLGDVTAPDGMTDPVLPQSQ